MFVMLFVSLPGMRLKAFFIFSLIITAAKAQQVHLTGSITDAQTNQPIASASISVAAKRLFFPADSAGKFDIANIDLAKSDSVAFSCIGYQTAKMLIGAVETNALIKLVPQVNLLREVKVRNAPNLINVGSKEKSSRLSVWQHTGEDKATYMEGSKNVKGTIQTVGFYLSTGRGPLDGGDVTAPFRIRLFKIDTTGKPGKEITNDIIIVSAKKDKAWFDFDISAYQIQNPDSGFFAAFSLLTIEYYKLKPGAKTTDEYGNKFETIDYNGVHHDLGTRNPADIIAPRLGVKAFTRAKPGSFHSVDTLQDMTWHWEPEYDNREYLIRATIAPDE